MKKKYVYEVVEYSNEVVLEASEDDDGDTVCGFFSMGAAERFIKENNISGYIKIHRVVD